LSEKNDATAIKGTELQKLLVLEDDADLRSEIVETLEDDGFSVRDGGTVAWFWREYLRFKPDLIILDLGLPDGRGGQVIRDVRAKSDTGILVLSGRKDEADRVIALEFGADDFVVKPCGSRELIARVSAILRRAVPKQAPVSEDPSGQRAVFGGYKLDLLGMELRDPEDRILKLTTTEFSLLRLFIERPQRVLSRDQLLDLLRGEDWAGYDRTIDGLVSRLRRKLTSPDGDQQFFKTVHGAGYVFTEPVSVG